MYKELKILTFSAYKYLKSVRVNTYTNNVYFYDDVSQINFYIKGKIV